MKTAEIANMTDSDKLPYLDLHCLPSKNSDIPYANILWKFADKNFVVCLLVVLKISVILRWERSFQA